MNHEPVLEPPLRTAATLAAADHQVALAGERDRPVRALESTRQSSPRRNAAPGRRPTTPARPYRAESPNIERARPHDDRPAAARSTQDRRRRPPGRPRAERPRLAGAMRPARPRRPPAPRTASSARPGPRRPRSKGPRRAPGSPRRSNSSYRGNITGPENRPSIRSLLSNQEAGATNQEAGTAHAERTRNAPGRVPRRRSGRANEQANPARSRACPRSRCGASSGAGCRPQECPITPRRGNRYGNRRTSS